MTWNITIDNIGGIRHAETTLEDGVNAVRAPNWQGKSSFLYALETVFGTEKRLTENADHADVTLEIDDTTYAIELKRRGQSIQKSGNPYLTDEVDLVCADLFAFLDETNEIRQAVDRGDNLEDLLTRPLDFEQIDDQITELKTERDQVDTELSRAEKAADRLPSLQEKVTQLESDLEDLHTEWESIDHETTEQNDAQERLSSLRASLSQTKRAIDRHESSLETAEKLLNEKRAELEELEVPEYEDVEAELSERQDELEAVRADRDLLSSLYEYTHRVLEQDRLDLITDLSRGVLADSFNCWVCGHETTRDSVEENLGDLEDRLEQLRAREASLEDNVEELREKQSTLKTAERKQRDLTTRISELEGQVASAEEDLADARDRRSDLEVEIDEVADTISTTEDEVTDLRSDIKYKEAELEDAQADLKKAKDEAAQRDTLQEERNSLSEEIETLRTRKERVKGDTRDAFDRALDDILERFDVGFETARLTESFDLIVARGGREASLDALSEGERQLLGIIAALAGYEAFNVADRLPIMLLDSHAGLDDTHIHHLVEYLSTRVDVLVLTAYPEYEDFNGHEISPMDWETVSFDSDAAPAAP